MTKMKDSGVKWIGQIPEDWETKPIRHLMIERNEKNECLQATTMLSLSAKEGVALYSEEGHTGNRPREDLSGYKVVRVGDIVVNSMNILSGAVGLSKYEGCVSPVYYTYFAREGYDIDFLNLIFQCKQFQLNLKGLGNGILIKESENGTLNTIRMRIPSDKLLKEEFPVCSLEKQKKIVEVLGVQCKKIDELIAIQEKEIEKLKEYKTSVITKAVTKGLDDSVPMKDSGIDWIGQIPAHWKVCKIKNIVKICNGREVESSEGDIPVYGSGGVFGLTNKHLYDKESVLLGRKGTIDKPIYIPDGDKIWCVDTMFYTIDKGIMNMKLFYYVMSVFDYKRYIYGTALPSMSQGILNEIYIPLPEYKEQLHLLRIIEAECDKMELLINKKQQKIEKLQEYKKSLIYEYVTGKKEV